MSDIRMARFDEGAFLIFLSACEFSLNLADMVKKYGDGSFPGDMRYEDITKIKDIRAGEEYSGEVAFYTDDKNMLFAATHINHVPQTVANYNPFELQRLREKSGYKVIGQHVATVPAYVVAKYLGSTEKEINKKLSEITGKNRNAQDISEDLRKLLGVEISPTGNHRFSIPKGSAPEVK